MDQPSVNLTLTTCFCFNFHSTPQQWTAHLKCFGWKKHSIFIFNPFFASLGLPNLNVRNLSLFTFSISLSIPGTSIIASPPARQKLLIDFISSMETSSNYSCHTSLNLLRLIHSHLTEVTKMAFRIQASGVLWMNTMAFIFSALLLTTLNLSALWITSALQAVVFIKLLQPFTRAQAFKVYYYKCLRNKSPSSLLFYRQYHQIWPAVFSLSSYILHTYYMKVLESAPLQKQLTQLLKESTEGPNNQSVWLLFLQAESLYLLLNKGDQVVLWTACNRRATLEITEQAENGESTWRITEGRWDTLNVILFFCQHSWCAVAMTVLLKFALPKRD